MKKIFYGKISELKEEGVEMDAKEFFKIAFINSKIKRPTFILTNIEKLSTEQQIKLFQSPFDFIIVSTNRVAHLEDLGVLQYTPRIEGQFRRIFGLSEGEKGRLFSNLPLHKVVNLLFSNPKNLPILKEIQPFLAVSKEKYLKSYLAKCKLYPTIRMGRAG